MKAFRNGWKRVTLALVAFVPALALSQVATLDVAVTDSDGEAAAAQNVTLQNASTGFAATVATNAQGRARFSAVPAADGYEIQAASQSLASGLRLRANEARALAVTLPLPAVLVRAQRDSAVIDSINAEVSAGLSGRELQALPVEARDLARALVRLPNVVPSTGFFPEAPEISINGANGLFAQYLVDGLDNNENFLGGPKFPVPIGLVQDVTVLAASYSAEYGRTGNGVVNVTTRSGTNDWRGEGFYLMRPGSSLDAASAFAGRDLSGNAVKDGFRRDQTGVAFGGPIVRDRTFVFVDAEYTRDEKDNLLSSPALGVNDTVAGTNRSLLLSTKIDHQLSDRWRLALRANHGDANIERQGGGLEGGVTFPSAGSVQDRLATLTSLAAIYDAGALTSESTLGYSRFRWNYGRPLGGAGPQVTVNGPDGLAAAVLGNPGFVFDELENSWQWQQKLTLTRGAHAIKLGADVLRSDFELAGGGNEQGNYAVRLTQAELDQVRSANRGTALDVGDIPATAEVQNYSVELRPARFGGTQTQTGVYAEDQISLTARLTATFGLRWDYDSLSRAGAAAGDRNNVAPRLALNFRVRPTLALRAGAGRFYEKIPYTVASDALQQNTTSSAFRSQLQQLIDTGILPAGTNLDGVTFDGNLSVSPACTVYLQCPTPATSQALRATAFSNERRIRNPSGLDNPYTNQFSLGVQWEPFAGVVAGADVIYAKGYNLLRLRDLNAPAPFSANLANLTDANIALLRSQPSDGDRRALAESLGLIRSQAAADATRPVGVLPGGARQIVVSETRGRSRYRALTLRLAKEMGEERYGYTVSYTLSKLTNDTDDINFRSANSNAFGTEWGPSVNDRRHVLSAVLFAHPLPDLTLSVAGLLQSGQPINYIPDVTIFGTTDLNGDGASFSDAYLGNSDRAPGVARNSGRLPWSKTVDLGARYAPALGDGRVELAVDVFNVFNQTNLSGFANSATQSNQIQVFGAPFVERNGAPPRQFQFGVRYLF
jgi:outer membrane receptor protein involved in Fe transport